MKTSLKFTLLSIIMLIFFSDKVLGQIETVIPPSNRSTTSLEKNMLFYSDQRYSVSQSGSTSLPLANLFDGSFQPLYSSPIDPLNPFVVLIENLPNAHVQAGAWIGWTTRFYNPIKFKIEIYNIHEGANTWVTVAEEASYSGFSYMALVNGAAVGKIRYTFYNASGPGNELGLSELFFIHPEGTVAYDGLLVKHTNTGDVGIGTYDTKGYKLAVNGKIRAQEIKVETANWPDYVFTKDYRLPTLQQTEQHIKEKGHLSGIPSAAEVKANGIGLGEMNAKLLQKIEELTLHLIEISKENKAIRKELADQKKLIINSNKK
ncbi:hypothetical protein [Pedobacter heparinus]|uniref:hypothetical protein n=1 Tax=Pedobacter heparinus TaxID=984 RepID=UPI00292D27F5|nr:hypothetical protein [Pedobacter heparinus]